MNKQRELLDKILNPRPSIQVWEAVVVSVQADTCKVKVLASELEVEDVRLMAEVGSASGLILAPKVGSTVLVGCIQNEIADLYVVQYAEIDALKFTVGNTTIEADKDTVTLKNAQSEVSIISNAVAIKQGQTEVVLSGEKVDIKNAGGSLKTLFSDLVTLLNSFSVITSTGPSAGLNPTTTALLTQLQTKVNLLLQ